MTLPAENQARGEAPTVAKLQQTVERVFDWIDTVLVNDVRPNTQAARAALRDLVAQAAELRAFVERIADEDCGEDGCVECFDNRKAIALLARLDGAR